MRARQLLVPEGAPCVPCPGPCQRPAHTRDPCTQGSLTGPVVPQHQDSAVSPLTRACGVLLPACRPAAFDQAASPPSPTTPPSLPPSSPPTCWAAGAHSGAAAAVAAAWLRRAEADAAGQGDLQGPCGRGHAVPEHRDGWVRATALCPLPSPCYTARAAAAAPAAAAPRCSCCCSPRLRLCRLTPPPPPHPARAPLCPQPSCRAQRQRMLPPRRWMRSLEGPSASWWWRWRRRQPTGQRPSMQVGRPPSLWLAVG